MNLTIFQANKGSQRSSIAKMKRKTNKKIRKYIAHVLLGVLAFLQRSGRAVNKNAHVEVPEMSALPKSRNSVTLAAPPPDFMTPRSRDPLPLFAASSASLPERKNIHQYKCAHGPDWRPQKLCVAFFRCCRPLRETWRIRYKHFQETTKKGIKKRTKHSVTFGNSRNREPLSTKHYIHLVESQIQPCRRRSGCSFFHFFFSASKSIKKGYVFYCKCRPRRTSFPFTHMGLNRQRPTHLPIFCLLCVYRL